ARHAGSRTCCGGRDTVLACAGFRDHSLRTELLREQHLAHRIVDLVRARVREVLSLQLNVGTPSLGESTGVRKRRRSSDPRLELGVEGLEKFRVAKITIHAALQPIEGGNERLR